MHICHEQNVTSVILSPPTVLAIMLQEVTELG